MKKFIIIVVSALLISIGIGFAAREFNPKQNLNFSKSNENIKKNSNNKKGNYFVDDVDEKELTNINEIICSSSSIDINIIPENRTNVKAHLHGKVFSTTPTPLPKLKVNVENNKLTINAEKKFSGVIIGIFNSDVQLDVYVPKSYKDSLTVNTSSGDINVDNMNLLSLKCKLNSGDGSLKNIQAKDFSYLCTSGELKGENIKADNSSINSSSGDLYVKDFSGNLDLKTSSGDANIQYLNYNDKINAHSSSGSITFNLPSSSQFHLKARTSSGNMHCSFPMTSKDEDDKHLEGIVGSDTNTLEIETSSGDIKIIN